MSRTRLLNRLTPQRLYVSKGFLVLNKSNKRLFTSEQSCPGVRGTALIGVNPASLSEFANLSSLSRKVSKLCSSV